MDIISTWIYLDSPEESSEYPQVGKSSHLPEFQKVYWRCVAVFFELSTRNNPGKQHILFSNVQVNDLPNVDGLDLKRFLQEKKVTLVTLPLTWQAPKGWHGKWRNQFYIFDILAHVHDRPDSDALLYSAGIRYAINKNMEVGVAYLYDYKKSRFVNNLADGGAVNGTFKDASASLLTCGFSYKF